MNLDLLKQELTRDEGRKFKPYKDTVGKTTIGVGRNLDDVGLSGDEIDLMLSNDISRASMSLDQALPWWASLSDARQRVMVNMCFNLGISRLMGFKNTLGLIQAGKYAEAADEMLKSLWAQQVGDRAKRLADMMRTG